MSLPSFFRVQVALDDQDLTVDFGDIRTALERMVALAKHYPEVDVLFFKWAGDTWELDRGRSWLRQQKTPQTDAA